MGIIRTFKNVYKRSKKLGYPYIYTLIDIHGTIFKPSYSNIETYEFYPFAKKALKCISKNDAYKIILWSSTKTEDFLKYNNELYKHGITISFYNENPLEKNTKISCFDEKFYFSVGFDDKFGFNPYIDWFFIWLMFKLHIVK